MKIAMVGAGKVGATLGTKWSYREHKVTFGVRSPRSEKIKILLSQCARGTRALQITEAANQADVLVLAVPWSAVSEVLNRVETDGKIIVDCTNPIGAGLRLLVEPPLSGAEQIAEWAPNAHIVKAFNTTGWENMANPLYDDKPLTLFYCGKNQDAKDQVRALIKGIGFEPWDVGELEMARHLESLAILWIHEAIVRGRGRGIALKMVRRSN